MCFDTLDTFGKEPEQLTNLQKAFKLVLWDYEFADIKGAFVEYLAKESKMPTPSDIVKLIGKKKMEETPPPPEKDDNEAAKDLIRKLGVAHYRRKLGVPKAFEPKTYELLEKYEQENNCKVEWESLEEYNHLYGAVI